MSRDDRLTMAALGYDGAVLAVGDRIELHPGLDLWARGARYGTISAVFPKGSDRLHVVLDRLPGKVLRVPAYRVRLIPEN